MARAADQFRQSDVTLWGIIALVTGAVAILCGNVSALIPDSVLAGLHASRLAGASVNEMRTEIANVEEEQSRLRAVNGQLSSRIQMVEQGAGAVVRRVGALEVSVPKLIEAIPSGSVVDQSTITGAIGQPKPAATKSSAYDVDGGSVRVTQFPLLPTGGIGIAAPQSQALPAPLAALSTNWAKAYVATSAISATGLAAAKPVPSAVPLTTASAAPEPTTSAGDMAQGVALGGPIDPAAASATWQSLSAKAAPLLAGLVPLLAHDPSGSGKLLVAGPIDGLAAAQALCVRFVSAGIGCSPIPFTGSALPRAGAASQ